jgi:hypothetical protein
MRISFIQAGYACAGSNPVHPMHMVQILANAKLFAIQICNQWLGLYIS